MPPVVPMVFGRAGLLERIGRYAPFAGGRLAREHETRHARAGELFELRGEVLATAALWVRGLLHVVMELAQGDRLVAVPFPPDCEQVGDRLPAPIALLRLAHPLGRVVTAKGQQRIADPTAPLREAAERKACINIG